MRRRNVVGIGLMVVVAGLAGCVSDSTRFDSTTLVESSPLLEDANETVVHVEPLRHGDRWAFTGEERIGGQGSDPRTYRWRADIEIEKETRTILDRFGLPAEVVYLRNHFTTLEAPEFDEPDGFEYEVSPDGYAAIETGEGNWLVSGVLWEKLGMGGFGGGGPDFCHVVINDTIPFYEEVKFPYDFGQLYGRTLRLGDYVNDTLEFEWSGHRIRVEVSNHVVNEATIPVPAMGGQESRPALVVEVSYQETDLDEPEPDPGLEGESEDVPEVEEWTRLWMVDGFAHPAKIVNHFRWGDEFTYDSEVVLDASVAGAALLRIRNGPVTAHIEGVHPDADPRPLEFAPDTSGLALAFPLDEAIAWLRTSPESLSTQQWLDAHPEAYLALGDYERDDANRTYRWDLVFADTSELHFNHVSQKTGVTGIPIKRAGTGAEFSNENDFPAPDVAAGVPVVQAELAAGVAAKFLPSPDGWTGFGFWVDGDRDWESWEFQSAQVYYYLAPGGVVHDGQGPLWHTGEMHWSGWSRVIDGSSGALIAASWAQMTCASGGFFLDLPI